MSATTIEVGPSTEGPLEVAKRVWQHPLAGPALRLVLAYVVLCEVVLQLLFGKSALLGGLGLNDAAVPRAIFLNGGTIGLLYGLLGLGLILVYRANRIINFAQAALGSVPAVVALLLIGRKGVNYFLVLPVVIGGGALLGGFVEVTIIRRFKEAPRLILTVATIGLSLLLLVLEFYVQDAITGVGFSSSDFRTPFTKYGFDLPPLRFTGDFILAAVVTAVLLAALGAFFRFTDMGIAVRASAENGERAALLGIPVRRVSTVVWIIAAVLSAIAVFLRAPMVGITLGSSIGPSVLLYGLAAAVIARMDSLSTCIVAGIGIGIIDQTAVFSTRRATLAIGVMLGVILLALLAQQGKLSRAFDSGMSSFQAAKEFRPIPFELRNVSEVQWAKGILGALVAFVAIGLPLLLPERFAGRFALVVIIAMVGVSLVILSGWAGQISLGQFAFSGVGAAVAGGLASNHGQDFFLCIFAGGLAGAAVAVLIGLPALRIQGLFLAVVTLAFAFTVENLVLNAEFFPWLLPQGDGFVARPLLYGRFSTTSDVRYYFLCLIFLGLSLLAARSLRKNRSGRILIGMRDNPKGTQAFGINQARTKLAAFALSGFIAATAGGLLAFYSQAVDAKAFTPDRSVSIFALTVIGGLTSLPGAMMGAAYVEGVPFLFNGSAFVRLLTSGLGLLVLLLFLPGGLSEGAYRIRDAFLRKVAARNDILVPSLVADKLVHEPPEEASAIADADAASAAAEEVADLDLDHEVEIDLRDPVIPVVVLPAGAGSGTTLVLEPAAVASPAPALLLAAPVAAGLIGCPVCGARLPVHEAHLHDHFRVAAEDPLGPSPAPAAANGNGSGSNSSGNGSNGAPPANGARSARGARR